jgi:hypothetical protein
MGKRRLSLWIELLRTTPLIQREYVLRNQYESTKMAFNTHI